MTNRNAIHLQGVEFGWQQGVPVLDVTELTVAAGERVFVKGPSGSGKTTLLSLVGGIVTPQRGTVQVLGQDLGPLSGAQRDRFRAHHIGFIFQMFNLIPYLTVLENVLLPCRFSRRRRGRIAAAGETPRAAATRLLQQLDLSASLLHVPVTRLSVGQQQRVAAARALIGAPELVVADEPTSALDTDRRRAFLSLLQQECQRSNTTLLFVSHDDALENAFQRTVHLPAINRASRQEVVA
ncbi:ABC transporter ATP-binding protein [Ketobacter sp.]|uniref:ABC transporter ATP-binding protein n=1 Tax=Ketobacter sp. TaxID=2083498 RepID=UPI000F16EEC1|nr:ABC transporter ATP-binding protein [Ketobacter sp.]RLU01930.1 MAG: ABC transporter ATP-binding protein [Ketobacter sp.]